MNEQDVEALKNQLKQNQAYNDHIVSQQNAIVKRFDTVASLEERVINAESRLRDLEAHYSNIANNANKVMTSHADELVKLTEKHNDLANIVSNNQNDQSKANQSNESKANEILAKLDNQKNSLEEFKARWLREWINLDANLSKHKDEVMASLKQGLLDNLKQIPETPAYLQDLQHKMRVFEIEVSKAVDKANHTEILYRALERRTRSNESL